MPEFITEVDVNYVGVLIAGVAAMILGALWYSPVLFGNKWIKLMKIDEKKMKEMQKGAGPCYAIGFVASLITACVLAHFSKIVGTETWQDGAFLGAMVWLGFMTTKTIGIVLWEKRPVALYGLNTSYNLVVTIIMGIIVTLWA